LSETEEIPVLDSFSFDLPASGGSFTGFFDGIDFVIRENSGSEIARQTIDSSKSILVNGSDQDDDFTFDLSQLELFAGSIGLSRTDDFEIRFDGHDGLDSLNTIAGTFDVGVLDHLTRCSGNLRLSNDDVEFDMAENAPEFLSDLRDFHDSNNNGTVDGLEFFSEQNAGFVNVSFTNILSVDVSDSTIDTLLVNLPENTDHDAVLVPFGNGVALASSGSQFSGTVFNVVPGGTAIIDLGNGNDRYNSETADATGIIVMGNSGDDILLGGMGRDILLGEDGQDYIQGAARQDQLFGGRGDDTVRGQGSDDLVDGGEGIDFIDGGRGTNSLVDVITGTVALSDNGSYNTPGGIARGPFASISLTGSDTDDDFSAIDFAGNVFLNGLGGSDILQAGTSDSEIHGGAGDDFVYGFTGDDLLFGGSGNDYLQGANGNDRMDGGSGDDIVRGMRGRDVLSGGLGNDRIDGGGQQNSISELINGDTTIRTDIDGRTSLTGLGNDVYIGAFGSVTIIGNEGDNVVDAVDFRGSTNIHGMGGDDILLGGSFRDTITGGDGNDYIQGGGGSDDLQGGNGDDLVRGQGAADIVGGGLGNDVIQGGAGINQVRESVDVDVSASGGRNSVQFTGIGTDTYSGEFFRVIIIGGDSDNSIDVSGLTIKSFIEGNGGDDRILGGSEQDIIDGGAGNDFIRSGFGNDILRGGQGSDLIIGDQGNDVVLGGSGNDILLGGSGRDIISGGEGNDFVKGNGGFDQLAGGSGDDNVVGNLNEIVDAFADDFDLLFEL
jgi:Ca2+-binding RTX toxin-like protein